MKHDPRPAENARIAGEKQAAICNHGSQMQTNRAQPFFEWLTYPDDTPEIPALREETRIYISPNPLNPY